MKQLEKIEQNQFYKTSFGPEENEELVEDLIKRRNNEKNYLDHTLTNQMQSNYKERQERSEYERIQDMSILEKQNY